MIPSLWLFAFACSPPPPAEASVPTGPATVRSAFPPPAGFERVEGDAFGVWLGDRPLLPADTPVTTHDGRVVGHRARVVDLPMVRGDLQQCADSAIRLRAEWQRATDQPVAFHATSGDLLPWARFRDGETPVAVGNAISWKAGSTGAWDDYLTRVFTWAGTDSLARLDTVATSEPRPGDLLVQGGFPGHAVVLLDVARRGDEVAVLVGEGFMPAQTFHVELGPLDGWWAWDGALDLGHWAFTNQHLRRFP